MSTKPKHVTYTIKRRNAMINLDEIAIGDEVTIRDGDGNLVIGQVYGASGKRFVKAFQTEIPFAREGKNDRWMAAKGIRVVGHTPSMFPVGVGS